MDTLEKTLVRITKTLKGSTEARPKIFRFDIFKGVEDSTGKVQKIRSVGSATLMEGARTYSVYLKTLLKDAFFLLPEEKKLTCGDYVILTREPSQIVGRKYFWNNIGEAYVLDGMNVGVMKLSFDLFGAEDIYMNLFPINKDDAVKEPEEAVA